MIKKCMLFVGLLISINCIGKKLESNKDDNSPAAKIKNDIDTLCSENFGGRLAGSEGERLSAEYIERRFRELGIPEYKNKYQWDFNFKGGVRLTNSAYFKVFESKLILGTDVLFLPYGKGNTIRGSAMPNVNEPDNIWLIPVSILNLNSTNNPQKVLYDYAIQCAARSAAGILFLNDMDATQDLNMQALNIYDQISIPVAYMNAKAYQTHVKPNLKKKDWIEIEGKLGYENANVISKNVIGCIDNKAPFHIVIAAHYDHLGNTGVLYKGADNNASGIAALLSVAEMIKAYNLKRFNYIFIAFSGKEFNMQGSKAFVQQNEFILNNISCMINLDMVGRLNNKRELYVAGVKTSPSWMPVLLKANKGFALQVDSSGVGYGDYNQFYEKNIPVLNVSTGFTDDYNRATDDEQKINYNGIFEVSSCVYRMVSDLDKQTKLIFNLTENVMPKLSNLKSDIGIIHDFTYNQNGCRVATTLPGSKAAIAGMLSGDVIIKIGSFNIIDTDDYIEALTKSAAGKETTIIVKRGKTDYKFFVVL